MIFSPLHRRNAELFAEIIGKTVLRIVTEFVGDMRHGKIGIRQQFQSVVHAQIGDVRFQSLPQMLFEKAAQMFAAVIRDFCQFVYFQRQMFGIVQIYQKFTQPIGISVFTENGVFDIVG